MKAKTFLLIALSCMLLMGCKKTKNEPETPYKDELKETALEIASYLTDNYQEGDSVYFLRTDLATGETVTEGFVVKENIFSEMDDSEIDAPRKRGNEDDDDKDEDEDDDEDDVFYRLCTALKSARNQVLIELNVYKERGKICTDGFFIINASEFAEGRTIKKDGQLTIVEDEMKCTLRKNTGVVSVLGKKYSWELVEKN